MTRGEVQALLAVIRDVYPAFHRGADEEKLRRVVDVWAAVLAGREDAPVRKGLEGYIAKNRFPPTPAEVLEEADTLLRAGSDRLQNWRFEEEKQRMAARARRMEAGAGRGESSMEKE